LKWHGQGLFKNVKYLIFWTIFVWQTFLLYSWIFGIKNSIFADLHFFLAYSKSKAQELSNDVSFFIFGHQPWDLERGGGVNLTPPAYPGFQVPQQR